MYPSPTAEIDTVQALTGDQSFPGAKPMVSVPFVSFTPSCVIGVYDYCTRFTVTRVVAAWRGPGHRRYISYCWFTLRRNSNSESMIHVDT
jgi:hypothetical protein